MTTGFRPLSDYAKNPAETAYKLVVGAIVIALFIFAGYVLSQPAHAAEGVVAPPFPVTCVSKQDIKDTNPPGSKFVPFTAAQVAEFAKRYPMPDGVDEVIVGSLPPEEHIDKAFLFGFAGGCLKGTGMLTPDALADIILHAQGKPA